MITRIKTTTDLQTATEALASGDRVCADLYHAHGLPNLRLRPAGFTAVLHAIVSQQVSTASAEAIINKLHTADLNTQERILGASEADLAAAGLSRQKRRYAVALAEANIDWRALAHMNTDEVVATLTAVTGIGQWTAEIYCMFSLGHADAFAAGDLALQLAAAELYEYELATSPTKRAHQVRAFAKRWSPYRAVAARLLWDYYVRQQSIKSKKK